MPTINDPDYAATCSNSITANNCDGYGLRILNSSSVLTYGAGFYSFFDHYNTSCSDQGSSETYSFQGRRRRAIRRVIELVPGSEGERYRKCFQQT
jgi:hypothetical protein